MDDIVTVLAEEHGCLDIIKVCVTSLLFRAVLPKTFYYCCIVFHVCLFEGFFNLLAHLYYSTKKNVEV